MTITDYIPITETVYGYAQREIRTLMRSLRGVRDPVCIRVCIVPPPWGERPLSPTDTVEVIEVWWQRRHDGWQCLHSVKKDAGMLMNGSTFAVEEDDRF